MTLNERIVSLCKNKGISQSQLERDIQISKGSVTKWKDTEPKHSTLQKIAEYFNVTLEYLTTGEESENVSALSPKDERDISKKLQDALDLLENSQDALMFDGEIMDDHTKELLKASLENSMKIAKINAKQKYTPNKYKK